MGPAGIGLGQLLISPVLKAKQAERNAQALALSPHEGAGGGGRTHTPLSRPGILSPVRLPVPPLRRRFIIARH